MFDRVDRREFLPRVMSREAVRDYLFRQFNQPETRWPCANPLQIAALGLPDQDEAGGPLQGVMSARCRKCEPCLLHRRNLWTARAVAELQFANRTWFGTLTLNPEAQWSYKQRAVIASQSEVKTLTSHDATELFASVVGLINPEITLFLKRLRKKNPEGAFRYLLVCERHKSGDPHFHMLLHECGAPIRKRALEAEWKLGFTHWRLLPQGDSAGAVYACKYLSKSLASRVRASQRYGQDAVRILVTERLQALSEQVARAGVCARATRRRDDAPIRDDVTS